MCGLGPVIPIIKFLSCVIQKAQVAFQHPLSAHLQRTLGRFASEFPSPDYTLYEMTVMARIIIFCVVNVTICEAPVNSKKILRSTKHLVLSATQAVSNECSNRFDYSQYA